MRFFRNGTEVEGDSSTCLLYEPDTGSIVHTHSVVGFAGAKLPTPEQVEEAMHVAADEWDAARPSRVDIQSGRIVPLTDLPSRRM
jgi:hypothetical protein